MTGSGGILNSEEVDFLLDGAEKSAGGSASPETDQIVTMHGDLEQINLSDIFQTLALTKMEGMLRVRNPLEQRHVYFRDGFVRILVPNRVATRRLGQRLVQAGLLEPDALRSALIEQRKESLPLGVLLAQKGYVAQEQVEEVVAMQVTEELFSLFTWRHGAFEFFKGECKDPLLLGRLESCPEFEVNSLLLEVARRTDEWEGILKSLGNLDEVPARTATESPADLTEGQQAILDAIDGKFSYRELAESSLLNLFDAARAARDLIEKELIGGIDDDAMLEVAGQLASQGHPKRAMVVLQTLRDRSGERPLPVIARMAEVLQQCGEARLAAHLLLQGAQLQTDASAALELARQARALAGRDVEVLRFLRATLTNHGEAHPGELTEVSLCLFDNQLEAGDVDGALEVLAELEKQTEHDPQLVQRRVRALQRKKDVPGAVAVLLELAEFHANKGERDKVIELYEQALKLDRDRKDIQKQLRVLTTTRKSRLVRLATMAVVLLLLLAAGIGYLHSNARSDAVLRATSEASKLLRVNDRVGARAAVARLQEQYGACTEVEDLQRQIDFNEQQEKVRVRREERRHATDQLAEAARLLVRAEVEDAFRIYAELYGREEMRQEVTEAVAVRLEAVVGELESIAKTLPGRLPPPPDERIEPHRIEENFAQVRDLLQPEKVAFCRNMEEFQQQRGLPNFVDPALSERVMKAVRAGKSALDRGQQRLHEYELAQQRNASERKLEPLFKAAIEQERILDFAGALASYRRLEKEHTGDAKLTSHFRDMVAKYATIMRFLGAIEQATKEGDFATAQSQYRALKLAYAEVPFEKIARLPLRVETRPAGAAVTWNGADMGKSPVLLSYLPCDNNVVMVRLAGFSSEQATVTGDQIGLVRSLLVCQPDFSVPTEGLADQHSGDDGDGRCFVVDRTGAAIAIDQRTGQVAWRWRSGDLSGLLTPPLVFENQVLVGSLDGTLRALDRLTGSVTWKRAGLPTEVPMVRIDGILAIATTDKRLVLLDAVTGAPKATANLLSPAQSGMDGDGRIIVLLQNSELVAISPTNANIEWRHSLPNGRTWHARPATGLVVTSSEDGEVTAYAIVDGSQKWRANLGGELIGEPVCDSQVAVVTMQDRIVLLDLHNGQQRGILPRLDEDWAGGTTIIADRLLAPRRDGAIVVLEKKNLETLYQIRGGKHAPHISSLATRGVLLGTDDRRVLLFRSLP